ncbi:hypothetical protein DENSPDRAFT_886474 [Dentipellis sp. KUC8613]|nr:hypothetical protein DENSPDRAFT_886474 [Dentipellis sp. KUC8613]
MRTHMHKLLHTLIGPTIYAHKPEEGKFRGVEGCNSSPFGLDRYVCYSRPPFSFLRLSLSPSACAVTHVPSLSPLCPRSSRSARRLTPSRIVSCLPARPLYVPSLPLTIPLAVCQPHPLCRSPHALATTQHRPAPQPPSSHTARLSNGARRALQALSASPAPCPPPSLTSAALLRPARLSNSTQRAFHARTLPFRACTPPFRAAVLVPPSPAPLLPSLAINGAGHAFHTCARQFCARMLAFRAAISVSPSPARLLPSLVPPLPSLVPPLPSPGPTPLPRPSNGVLWRSLMPSCRAARPHAPPLAHHSVVCALAAPCAPEMMQQAHLGTPRALAMPRRHRPHHWPPYHCSTAASLLHRPHSLPRALALPCETAPPFHAAPPPSDAARPPSRAPASPSPAACTAALPVARCIAAVSRPSHAVCGPQGCHPAFSHRSDTVSPAGYLSLPGSALPSCAARSPSCSHAPHPPRAGTALSCVAMVLARVASGHAHPHRPLRIVPLAPSRPRHTLVHPRVPPMHSRTRHMHPITHCRTTVTCCCAPKQLHRRMLLLTTLPRPSAHVHASSRALASPSSAIMCPRSSALTSVTCHAPPPDTLHLHHVPHATFALPTRGPLNPVALALAFTHSLPCAVIPPACALCAHRCRLIFALAPIRAASLPHLPPSPARSYCILPSHAGHTRAPRLLPVCPISRTHARLAPLQLFCAHIT